jgi:uncharacterized protein (DUF1015 family)
MPEFIPLTFETYDWANPALAADLVAAPPYDVLSNDERNALAAKSPHNVVRIDLPESYEGAASLLDTWRGEGTLARTGRPSFFLLATGFELDGVTHLRWSVLGGLRLAPWGQGGVYPHEKTYPRHKKDRLDLMRATKASLSPIFGVFQGDGRDLLAALGRELSQNPPLAAISQDDGVTHRLWPVPADHEPAIQHLLANRKVYIADGHHRYETALAYQEERGRGQGKWDYVFVALSDLDSDGVKILPYHRMLTWAAKPDWDQALCTARDLYAMRNMDDLDDLLASRSEAACGLIQNGKRLLMEPKDPARDLAPEEQVFARIGAYVLDRDFLRASLGLSEDDLTSGGYLAYTPFAAEALAAVEEGHAQAALLLKAVDMDVLRLVSEQGLTMPRKSTYFHPKLPTGLLFYPFD